MAGVVEFKAAFDDIRNPDDKSEEELEEEIANRLDAPTDFIKSVEVIV